ncbi:MAG TPA: glycosyl hydrolase family 18 protein, partial [Pseudosphingobacterium sp.]|nr:glycosyl hydrolase family 18 protein [Pseudosphingobacterium sp.]
MKRQSGAGMTSRSLPAGRKQKKATRLGHGREVIGYVTQWDAWKDISGYVPKGGFNHLNVDYSQYTILNFSFFGVAKDGSLHSGDFRNKQIYLESAVQEPAALIHPSPYDSWDVHILYGEVENVWHIIDGGYAYRLGYRMGPGGNEAWIHPESGRSGPFPLVIPKENGAPGLIDKAHANGVKVMASLGGWSMCKHFPEMALDQAKRERFLQDCDTLIGMGFDGIDIDWEYPNDFGMNIYGHSEEDYKGFEDLMDALRSRLGSGKLITAAMAAAPAKLAGFNWSRLNRSMDYFNMMTYDFHGGWSDSAGHNSPLYNYPGGTDNFSVDGCVCALRSYGADMSKVNIGGAFYGRGVITAGPAGLNQATVKKSVHLDPDGPVVTAADYDNWSLGVWDGTPNYGYIQQITGSWHEEWDDVAKVPYKTSGNYFLSYDNERSIRAKAAYIKEQGLAGVIIWQVWGDMEQLTTNTEKK